MSLSIQLVLCVSAYVLGSIPFGLLVGKARGIDIRTVGSGNIGATNVARALGKPWAIFVLIFDALKGFVPVYVTREILTGTSPWLVAAVGLSAIVGHMFTVFLRGQGGKGVATSLGVAVGLSPPIALSCLGIYVIGYSATRLSSVGSLLGMWAFPAIALIRGTQPRAHVALSVACALLVTWRHRDNIRRIVRGEERGASSAKRA